MNKKTSSVLFSVTLALSAFNPVWASEIFEIKQQGEVIEKLATALENRYVLEQEGKQFAEQLRKTFEAGTWSEITNKKDFIEALNTRLYQITRDKHVNIRQISASNNQPTRKMVRINPSNQNGKVLRKKMGLPQGNSITSDILPGNIGLLTINDLMGNVSDIHLAMKTLQDTDGLVIDVRQCPGGKGQIAYNLASYFMDEGNLLMRYHTRGEPVHEQKSVVLPKGNKRYYNKPVYLVTSSFTGSACEALSYVLKYHNLATIIGENTAGAGHALTNALTSVGYGLEVFVPNTRPEHPNHHGGFEKIGVPEDIYSSPTLAITRAQQLILTKLMNDNPKNTTVANIFQSNALKLNNQLLQQAEDRKRYQPLISEYGKAALIFDQGELKYRSTTGRLIPLKANGNDEFISTIKRAPITVRIERDQHGEVTGIRLPTKPGQNEWTVFARI